MKTIITKENINEAIDNLINNTNSKNIYYIEKKVFDFLNKASEFIGEFKQISLIENFIDKNISLYNKSFMNMELENKITSIKEKFEPKL